jgi:hypothetical protein
MNPIAPEQMKPTTDHPEEPLIHPDDPTNNEPLPKASRPTYNLQVFRKEVAIGWLGQSSPWVYYYPDQNDPHVLQLAWYENTNFLTMTNNGWLSYYGGYAGYPAKMRDWSYAVKWNKIDVGKGFFELQAEGTNYKLSQYSDSNKEIYCTNNYTPLQFRFIHVSGDFPPLPTDDWRPRSKELPNIPGVPIASYLDRQATEALLVKRAIEVGGAQDGLSVKYTIGGKTAAAKDFLVKPTLIGSRLTPHSLEHPEQSAISWTTYKDVYKDAEATVLKGYVESLSKAEAATAAFWPMIAKFGTGYNLLIPRLIDGNRLAELKKLFGASSWPGATVDQAQQQGRLYEIDFSIVESFGPVSYQVDGQTFVRFNPATLTILERSADGSGQLRPVAIRVWDKSGPSERSQIYTYGKAKDGAWLYALQAAKTSATLYGIWMGHVYHWHIVNAAMQRTKAHTIPGGHPIDRLLKPQASGTFPSLDALTLAALTAAAVALGPAAGITLAATLTALSGAQINYLIAFDDVLLNGSPLGLVNWEKIAPPSRINTPEAYVKLTDIFARGRQFFDDDPRTELAARGLKEADFTRQEPWDLYPAAQNLLRVWQICEDFVGQFVHYSYSGDLSVQGDEKLQWWIWASGDPRWGNIRGLPKMNTMDALKRILTSLVYRGTIHGVSRLNDGINPALSFVANFPPCLQRADFPKPDSSLDTQQLLTYLPNTGTIGDMLGFYFAFVFSTPYHPLIPEGGLDHDLYFDGGKSAPLNVALIKYRKDMQDFMTKFQPKPPNIAQWPRCIET